MKNIHHNVALLITENQAKILGIDSEYDAIHWLTTIPQLNIIGNVVPIIVRNSIQKNDKTEEWIAIAATLENQWKHYSGFVVLHEHYGIEYAACAIHHLIEQQGKPIIFTGTYNNSSCSNEKLERYNVIGTHANIINACQLATLDIAETALLFGNTLIKAALAKRTLAHSLNTFTTSQEEEPLGKIDFQITLSPKRNKRNEQMKPVFFSRLEQRIATTMLHPTTTDQQLDHMLQQDIKAVIISVLSQSILTEEHRQTLRKAQQRNIAVILHEETHSLQTSPFISIHNMTFPALLTKCMQAIPQSMNNNHLRKLLETKKDEKCLLQ